ncbi:MAG: hypothetical protein FWG07_08100, partial [Treponema sp.]|nr:hypothetical protein [Treponema sp.]
MITMLHDFLQNSNLVIFGCCPNAEKLLDIMPDLVNRVIGCVDIDINKQGQLFFDKWIVASPIDFLDKNNHRIIVTPQDPHNAITYLNENEYLENHDYIVLGDKLDLFILNNTINVIKQYTNHMGFIFP